MGINNWNDLEAATFTEAERLAIEAEAVAGLLEGDLRAIREAVGLTQTEAAGRSKMSQSEVSRLERRADHRLSTLRRYVRALGG